MWEEIIKGTLAGNYTIEDLQELFNTNKKVLKKDCKTCEYNYELKRIKKLSKLSAKKMKKLKNTEDASDAALANAKQILQFYHDLPDSLIGIVDIYFLVQFSTKI